MQFLVVAVLVCIVCAEDEVGGATIKSKHMFVSPRQPAGTPKIVGGQEAEPHSIPYQVSVVSAAFCGGSLIRQDVVLTAAHCVVGVRQAEVTAGAHNLYENERTKQIVKSKRIIIHEGWESWHLTNDIALVILASNISLDDTAAIIELNEESSSLEGEDAIISGWGSASDSTGEISPVLRYAIANIMGNKECDYFYPSYIQRTNICLDGSRGKSFCGDDYGGPLCIRQNGKPIQVGIGSFGTGGGCEIGYPSVYTRVSEYTEWIKNNLP